MTVFVDIEWLDHSLNLTKTNPSMWLLQWMFQVKFMHVCVTCVCECLCCFVRTCPNMWVCFLWVWLCKASSSFLRRPSVFWCGRVGFGGLGWGRVRVAGAGWGRCFFPRSRSRTRSMSSFMVLSISGLQSRARTLVFWGRVSWAEICWLGVG